MKKNKTIHKPCKLFVRGRRQMMRGQTTQGSDSASSSHVSHTALSHAAGGEVLAFYKGTLVTLVQTQKQVLSVTRRDLEDLVNVSPLHIWV